MKNNHLRALKQVKKRPSGIVSSQKKHEKIINIIRFSLVLFFMGSSGLMAGPSLPEISGVIENAFPQAVKKIRGVITDTNNEPIIGANIVVKGTTNGTISDYNGAFELNAPEQATLVISYIGYLDQEVTLSPTQNQVSILLIEDTQVLDEVVVTGYSSQKKNRPYRGGFRG